MAIDEKKLIEDMLNNDGIDFRMDFNTDTEDSVLESLREFADKFRQGMIELVQKQPKVGEWIPCTVVDHPEHCNDCEVTRKDTIGYIRDIAFYTDRWRRLADEMPVDVIAWKEPSKPYKE